MGILSGDEVIVLGDKEVKADKTEDNRVLRRVNTSIEKALSRRTLQPVFPLSRSRRDVTQI
jgi:hypothetical protein